MGYTTDFCGAFNFDKSLNEDQVAYLTKFSETRRMKRNVELTKQIEDSVREAVGLPVGEDGSYFVGGESYDDSDIVNYNTPPSSQPGLWCQWVPTEDGESLVWDGNEKFYNYVEWLEYLIENFIKPWGYKLNGEVEWQGEDSKDVGKIVVNDNNIKVLVGKIVYEERED